MTVLDEKNPREIKKYDSIVFVEFLEMICRLSFVCAVFKDTIEVKVYHFLHMIYQHRYTSGKWNPDDHPLYEIPRPE